MAKFCLFMVLILTIAVYGEPIGGIQKVENPAYRMPAAGDSFHTVQEKELIDWGDSLKTGIHGFMGILFQDGSLIKMSGNTAIKLTSPEEEGVAGKTIKIKFGDLWAKIIRSDQAFIVKTPSSIASVKGTKFWIMVTPSGDSRLLCQEGLIDFINTISGMQMFVAKGQMCSAGMDGSLEITDVHPEEEGGGQQPSPEYYTPPTPEEGEPQGGMTPQGGPGGYAPPTPAPSGGIGPSLGMNGAVGVSTINGQNYQYFSLRPDISIWKFGIGLDLSFYFDSEGNLREEDWDEAEDYVDKIYYLRYGRPGEPFFLRVGSLSPITLGYGLIMKRYTNAIEWPQVRRVGLQTEIRKGGFTFHGLINNFREIGTPGLLGVRLTYETNLLIPVVFGGTFVYDGNQYLGAKDEDGDGIPNQLDMFPGKDDEDHINWLKNELGLSADQINQLIASGDLPDINNPPQSIENLVDWVSEWGLDVGIPLIRSRAMNLWLYAQMAQIVDYGRGYTFPGLMFNLGPFRAGVEYRIFEKEFMAEFFDMAYETERVVWDEALNNYVTKEYRLKELPSAQGYYAEIGLNLFNFVDVMAAYQNMAYDGDIPNESVYASGSLNTKFIPKVDLAEAYYQQPNVDKIFKTKSDGTILGYRVGLGLGAGIMVIYDNKTIYYNGEPNRIMTIETAVTF